MSLSYTPSIRRLSLLALPSPPPTTLGPCSQARRVSPSLERAPHLPDLDIREGTGHRIPLPTHTVLL